MQKEAIWLAVACNFYHSTQPQFIAKEPIFSYCIKNEVNFGVYQIFVTSFVPKGLPQIKMMSSQAAHLAGSLLNLNWHTTKFHNCYHKNLYVFSHVPLYYVYE